MSRVSTEEAAGIARVVHMHIGRAQAAGVEVTPSVIHAGLSTGLALCKSQAWVPPPSVDEATARELDAGLLKMLRQSPDLGVITLAAQQCAQDSNLGTGLRNTYAALALLLVGSTRG